MRPKNVGNPFAIELQLIFVRFLRLGSADWKERVGSYSVVRSQRCRDPISLARLFRVCPIYAVVRGKCFSI